MKKFILTLMFGDDEIIQRFGDLVRVRRAAIREHANGRKLAEKLKISAAQLVLHKQDYAMAREQVESSYRLELD